MGVCLIKLSARNHLIQFCQLRFSTSFLSSSGNSILKSSENNIGGGVPVFNIHCKFHSVDCIYAFIFFRILFTLSIELLCTEHPFGAVSLTARVDLELASISDVHCKAHKKGIPPQAEFLFLLSGLFYYFSSDPYSKQNHPCSKKCYDIPNNIRTVRCIYSLYGAARSCR